MGVSTKLRDKAVESCQVDYTRCLCFEWKHNAYLRLFGS